MAERAITPANVPKTYAELRRAVELTLIQGQQAVEQAKVRTYWDTGRLIHEHVLLFQDRADYGAGTIAQLAADMQYHRSTLQRCVQFYLAIPNCAARRNLVWGHYKALITVTDSKLRYKLADEANRHEWSAERLQARIVELAPAETIDVVTSPVGEPQELLQPIRGTPGLHLIVERAGGLAVDLGFKLYWPLTPDQAKRLAKGDIVRIASDDSLRKAEAATRADLFTYGATLVRVVDGDTLVVELEVSPGVWHEIKLRLRGLDCPEISTPEGRAAKRFVDGLMAGTPAVVISTSKPDKYERYLADVFLAGGADQLKGVAGLVEPGPGSATPAAIVAATEEEIFLNNALLGGGFAVRYDGGAKEEE